MQNCEWCNKEFDEIEAEQEFEDEETLLSYKKIRKCLCGSCAIDAIEENVEDVYYETCEKCGKEFDLIEDEAEFEERCEGTSLTDWWLNNGIICCDCAIKIIEDDERY